MHSPLHHTHPSSTTRSHCLPRSISSSSRLRSPLNNPTNRRPSERSHMRASSYHKILHYTRACILVHRLLHMLDICPPCLHSYMYIILFVWITVTYNRRNPHNKVEHVFIMLVFVVQFEHFFFNHRIFLLYM